jgi:hypothetical protein
MHWSWINCGFTALGVLILYARWGKAGVRHYVPKDVIKTLHLSADRTSQIEFVMFVVVGTIIAVVFADPQTARQSVAAGLGWTGLLAPNKLGRI